MTEESKMNTHEMQSDDIKGLAKALATAQSELTDPEKTHHVDAGAMKYDYADLTDLLKVARPVLSKNGLSFSHTTKIEDGMLMVYCTLRHSSGGEIVSQYPAAPITAKHQNIGAGMTYARRYTLQSIIGVAAESDTDAEGSEPAKRMSSAEAKRANVWGEFLSDLEDVHTQTGLERLIRYYETNVYPRLKTSWIAQIDGEFDAARKRLGRPIEKQTDDMSNAELDEIALEKDGQHPLEAG